jgi:XTP/dITP diphosphohydrolase
MEIVIATNNAGKLNEIQAMLPGYILHTMRAIGFTDNIPEPYETFEQNALTKAQTVYHFCGKAVMADDSGICIAALDDKPGVYSARYAGPDATDHENVQKALQELQGIQDRSAYYKAVICLILNEQTYFFEGFCHGTITEAPIGEGGFGYDPIFVPNGYSDTFAQLPLSVKNGLSHRGEAIRKMVAFLKEAGETQES